MGNHTFNENTDSSTVPVLIYKSKQGLTESSEKNYPYGCNNACKKNKSKCIAKNIYYVSII
jgi:hypothetical protein